MPYTLTTYEGEKIKLMEQSPERIRDLAGEAGMIAIQDSNGQIHYLGKGRLASINYTKPEGLVVRPEQRSPWATRKIIVAQAQRLKQLELGANTAATILS